MTAPRTELTRTKLIRNALPVAVLAALTAPAAHAEIAIDMIGGSEVSVEGMIQTDAYWYDSDLAGLDTDAGDGDDADYGLRRAELVLKGKGPGNIDWVIGYDAVGDGKFLDVNARYRIGGSKTHFLQVGQYKQPNSMEELSSSKNNDFISKAMITNTLAVGRRLGVAYSYGSDDWTLTGSAFGRELTRNRAHGSGYGVRGNWAPVNDKGNAFNIGLSYANYDTDADTLRYRVRPDADFANRLIDTGTLADTDRVSIIGLESFWIKGPFKLQGEYMRSDVQRYGPGSDDFNSSGGYVSGVWNVSGENWSNKAGTPGTPGAEDPARGMWQLGLRYDTLDLDDGSVQGGRMDTWTAGLNYYWRSNFKFMLDYVRVDSQRHGIDDDPGIVQARAQFFW